MRQSCSPGHSLSTVYHSILITDRDMAAAFYLHARILHDPPICNRRNTEENRVAQILCDPPPPSLPMFRRTLLPRRATSRILAPIVKVLSLLLGLAIGSKKRLHVFQFF